MNLFTAKKIEAAPNHVSMLKGVFKSCLKGICHLVSEVYFIENECFNNQKELGIYYYLNNLLHIAQLTGEYEIIDTNCTMSADDELKIDDIGLYNFINDRYDIAYLIIIAAAKIIIVVLCLLLYKYRKRLAHSKKKTTNQIIDCGLTQMTADTHLQTIQERTQPTAPPPPNNMTFVHEAAEITIPETRGSLLSSTCMGYPTEIYPSFSSISSTIYNSQTRITSCTCHATEVVCTNCSCVRNKRPCNSLCHIPNKNANKSKRQTPIAFKCGNKFNFN